MYLILIVLTVLLECKTEKRNSLNTDSQWSKQEACFARATQVWLAVNHNTSVTSFWRMNSMFEINCNGKVAWQLSINFFVVHEAMNGCQNLKIHLRLALKMKIYMNIFKIRSSFLSNCMSIILGIDYIRV